MSRCWLCWLGGLYDPPLPNVPLADLVVAEDDYGFGRDKTRAVLLEVAAGGEEVVDYP